MRSSSKTESAGDSVGRNVRILRPTNPIVAQFSMTLTLQIASRSLINACCTASATSPSPISMDTVTFVSEVETRSIETPCWAKHANALARKPTSCHIEVLSIEISVTPLRVEMPFTCGSDSCVTADTVVP